MSISAQEDHHRSSRRFSAASPYPESPLPLPPGTLYNEFDHVSRTYRHVDAAAPALLGGSAAALAHDALGTWSALLPDALIEPATARLWPDILAALHAHAPTLTRFDLQLTYPMGKTAPYRVVEHRLDLHVDPKTRLPLYHRGWLQLSLGTIRQLAVHLQLSPASQSGPHAPVLVRSYRPPNVFDTALSKRERVVAHHMIKGSSSAQIAEQYFISVHTVSSHRRNILLKTGTRNTAELIWLAASLGWTGQA